jgi:hypothetical protein
VTSDEPTRSDKSPTSEPTVALTCTINPKLLDEDNVSTDALKRRKLTASKSVTQSTQSSNDTSPSARVTPSTSQQASIEVVDDDDDAGGHNAGAQKMRTLFWSQSMTRATML